MPGIYYFCWYFLIFSVVGWTIESALVSVQEKRPVNRGFLAGPFCPIYGTAMCIIVLALTPIKLALLSDGLTTSGVLLMLLASAVIACAVEYFVGFMLEKMFHQRWWDYSDHRINLNGRIAVPESLAWGPLATLAVLFGVPWLDSIIDRVPRLWAWIGFGVIAAVILLDVVRILKKMNTFDKLAAALKESVEEFWEKLEDIASRNGRRREARTRRYKMRAKRLRRRLSMAYPKLGEKWRILRDMEDDDEKRS